MRRPYLPLTACVSLSLIGELTIAVTVAGVAEKSGASDLEEPPLASVTWTCEKTFAAPGGVFITDVHADQRTGKLTLASTARIFELTDEWRLADTKTIERPQWLSGEGNHHFIDVDGDGSMELINLGEADLRGVALYHADGRLAWTCHLYDQHGFRGGISYVIPSKRKDGDYVFYVLSQLSSRVVTLDSNGKVLDESTWDRLNTPHAVRWGDINRDGSTDIFYGCLNKLVVRDADGAVLWREALKKSQFVNIIRALPSTPTSILMHVQASASGQGGDQLGQVTFEWRWPTDARVEDAVVVPCHENECMATELAGDVSRSFQYRNEAYYAVASAGSPQGGDGRVMGRAARVVICNANGTVVYQRVLVDETAGRFLTGASMEVVVDEDTPEIALGFGGSLWRIAPKP